MKKEEFVISSLTQLVGTIHNICKVWVQTPVTTKKERGFFPVFTLLEHKIQNNIGWGDKRSGDEKEYFCNRI